MRSFRSLSVLCALCCALAFGACTNEDDATFSERSIASLYNDGVNQMYRGRYLDAARLFAEVGYQHPYSWWASKGELMAAFCYYKANSYNDALTVLDRFIELHPAHKDIAYAYFLRAMSYYEQVADVQRDQNNTLRALAAFEQLRARFPDSSYAGRVGAKINLLRDNLAGKDMVVGRFYQTKGYWLASIQRFQVVITEYGTTAHTREALYRMVESYLALGITLEARRVAAVLGYNFPNDDWYKSAYQLLYEDGLVDEDAPSYSKRGFDLSEYVDTYIQGSESY